MQVFPALIRSHYVKSVSPVCNRVQLIAMVQRKLVPPVCNWFQLIAMVWFPWHASVCCIRWKNETRTRCFCKPCASWGSTQATEQRAGTYSEPLILQSAGVACNVIVRISCSARSAFAGNWRRSASDNSAPRCMPLMGGSRMLCCVRFYSYCACWSRQENPWQSAPLSATDHWQRGGLGAQGSQGAKASRRGCVCRRAVSQRRHCGSLCRRHSFNRRRLGARESEGGTCTCVPCVRWIYMHARLPGASALHGCALLAVCASAHARRMLILHKDLCFLRASLPLMLETETTFRTKSTTGGGMLIFKQLLARHQAARGASHCEQPR